MSNKSFLQEFECKTAAHHIFYEKRITNFQRLTKCLLVSIKTYSPYVRIVFVQVKISQKAPLKSSNGNSVWRLCSDYSGKSHTPTGTLTEVRCKPTRSLLGRQLNPYLL